MDRTLPRLLAALAGMLLIPIVPTAAAAETLTWTVQPADERGPDGRRWVEHTLDPGRALTERLAVRNFSDTSAVFALKAADGYFTDKGRFNMLASDQPSVDGGTWIAVQPTVTVGAGETKVVPFTITVPAGATPGDHPADIAATITSTGGQVNVESRVGFRVMIRAGGTINASLGVTGVTAGYHQSWNPFAPGALRVRYTVTNTGNVWVSGHGGPAAGGRKGQADVEELLPGGTRSMSIRLGEVWALGRVRTTVTMTPVLLGDPQPGVELRPVTATVTTWVLPWPQLVLLLLLAGLVLLLRTVVRGRRQRLAKLLDRAREEGREAALATS